MSEFSSFFKSIVSDRLYTADEFAQYFRSFLTRGIIELTQFAVTQSSPTAMTVEVAAGKAILEGYYYQNTGSKTMPILTADTVYARIDRVVLRLDANDGVRSIIMAVKTGTPAASPVAPSLVTNYAGTGQYEISLAQIAVAANATTILTANITDERSSINCGRVAVVGNTGDQTSIVGITGTTSQFNTALTDGDFATLAGSETLANKTLTTPKCTTNITTPAIIGGTSTTQAIIYRTTTGVGTTGSDHIFQVGNNGSIEALRVKSSGNIGVKNPNPAYTFDVIGTIVAGDGTRVGGISYATYPLMGSFSNHNVGIVSNSITRITVDTTGVIGIANLAGTGTRPVVVSSTGELEASTGVTGTFTTANSKTVTVTNGIITSIV